MNRSNEIMARALTDIVADLLRRFTIQEIMAEIKRQALPLIKKG